MSVKRNYAREVHSQRNYPENDGWPAGVIVHEIASYAVAGGGDDIHLYEIRGIGNLTAQLTPATVGSRYIDCTSGSGKVYVATGTVIGGTVASWSAQA